jgi:hypothetical protein
MHAKSLIFLLLNTSLAVRCVLCVLTRVSVATFEGMGLFHVDYKIILIIAQVLGYALSKFIGVLRIKSKNEYIICWGYFYWNWL